MMLRQFAITSKPILKAMMLVIILCIVACNRQDEGTRKMANRLADLETRAFSSPDFPYANELRVQQLAAVNNGIPYNIYWPERAKFIKELLAAGYTKEAVEVSESVIQQRFGNKLHEESADFFRLAGLANLRYAEEVNCITNHTSSSCIIPIRPEGYHQDTTGAAHAMRYYTRLVAFDSLDYESRWLLNIAAMTLGKYPHEVPKDALIKPDAFSGIDFPYFEDVAHHRQIVGRGHAGGSIMEDFNNDGRLDLFMTSYLLGDQCQLLIQQEDGTFSDITLAAGLKGITGGLNCIQADYNNDGWIDILILRGAWLQQFGMIPNSLLKNNGDGTFSDVTEAAGMLSYHPTQTAAWVDVNLDGFLDVFIGNESNVQSNHSTELYINNQDGTFTEKADELGASVIGVVKGVSGFDADNDGDQDLYVSVLGGSNHLLINMMAETGTAKYVNKAGEMSVYEPRYSFPVLVFDIDNNGYDDVVVSGYYGENRDEVASQVAREYLSKPVGMEKPRVYLNGAEGFEEQAADLGLDKALYTMGGNFGDLNNDGWEDIYFGTGEFNLAAIVPNRMFVNTDGTHFEEVTASGGFGQIQKGHGVSFGDIDNDGDQDIFTVIGGALQADVYTNMLFDNPGFDSNWIQLELEGTSANRSAIGARIKVVVREGVGERAIFRTVSSGGSFGANSLRQEVGLGNASIIEKIIVTWPGSSTPQVYRDLEVNQRYRLIQDNDAIKRSDTNAD